MDKLPYVFFGAVTSITIWSTRRLNQRVQRIPVPRTSLLIQKSKERGDNVTDTFVMTLPPHIQNKTDSPVLLTNYVRSFYSSTLFEYLERPVLKNVFTVPEPVVETLPFQKGDQYLAFIVEERTDTEILLKWNCFGMWGSSWYAISPDHSQILFGTSWQLGSYQVKNQVHGDFSPSECCVNALSDFKNNPEHYSFSERIKECVSSIGFASSVSAHYLYSRFLLDAAMKKLCEEKK